MTRTLRITFNGISTLTPAPPRNGETAPDKAYVLMPANRYEETNDWNEPVPPHVAFISVPVSILADPIPEPSDFVDDETLGRCNIYYIDHARVTVGGTAAPLEYFMDADRPIRKRPGSIDVAPEHDIRWLTDARDILPEQTGPTLLKASANPQAPGQDVAVVVDLAGGMLKANFPCKAVQPKTFADADGNVLPNFQRVLATEFLVDMPFPEGTETVTLRLTPLHGDQQPLGIPGNELRLKWGSANAIQVRMGNDTAAETKLLGSFKRCDARFRREGDAIRLIPRDEDFHIFYRILDLPATVGRRVPQTGPHQTQFDGCVPIAAS